MSEPKVWLDGELVEAAAARVSALDHGVTVGDGVFETLRVYGGTPFAVTRHLERLAHSAGGLGLRLPDRELLARALTEVVEASGLADARLRLTVTGGPAPLGSGRSDAAPTVIAAVAGFDPLPPTADVITVPWPRNERGVLAGMKTTSYGENVVALSAAVGQGASEAIFANTRGELCEGTGTNVFIARGGRLMTPPLSSGCLAGITRALVLETTAAATEATVALSALTGADEAFLTSSTREVQPIAAVDGRSLPTSPGPLTEAAMAAYADLLARDLDP